MTVSSLFAAFHIANGSYTGLLPIDIVKSIHLAFVLALAFLLFPARRGKSSTKIPLYDVVLACVASYTALYIAINYEGLLHRAAIGFNTMDYVISALGIILVLEATRRVVNPALVVIAIVFILYAKFGNFLPLIDHKAYTWKEVLEHLYLTKEGIFGTPLTVSATFVILFIIFGAFLEKSGAGKFFIDLAFALTGRLVGGPAKAAVVSSALMGTISGSSVANTVTTGSFTIPLMKKAGYRPEFAGAVEPAASTGGQIMPPIMGAAAFIMAEFVGMPYINIVYAAMIPAFLYFFGVFTAVDLEARKENLRGLPKEELPGFFDVLRGGWYYLIPVFVIIYMLVSGYTPLLAAVYAILVVVAIIVLKPFYINLKRRERKWNEVVEDVAETLVEALSHGGRSAVAVALACASAGIIVGVVTLTGLGFKIAAAAIDISQGQLILILLLTMLVSLVLGMGVPTTANYIITSTIAAPAIITFMAASYGLNVRDFIHQFPELILPAHMFVFYFGVAADLTPPVALAAYAGSAIAGSDPWKTGLNAFKIGIGKYIVPYVFIFTPSLLLIGVTPSLSGLMSLLLTMGSVMLGIFAVNAGTIGYMSGRLSGYQRILAIISGILILSPSIQHKFAGVVILVIVNFIKYIKDGRPVMMR